MATLQGSSNDWHSEENTLLASQSGTDKSKWFQTSRLSRVERATPEGLSIYAGHGHVKAAVHVEANLAVAEL